MNFTVTVFYQGQVAYAKHHNLFQFVITLHNLIQEYRFDEKFYAFYFL